VDSFAASWNFIVSESAKKKPAADNATVFSQQVAAKAARKLKARKSGQGVWFGLGMMGLIGWSVVVPTLLGAALGIWLDTHHPGKHPWTLALLIVGLAIGCLNAWHWVAKEDKEMREEQGNNDE
jgi:ATP synthase protein I